MKDHELPVIAVIPAHNAAETLPILLDELIRQKYDNIFVLDDASTDDTLKVVRSYKSKVKLIEGKENVGSGANRNRIIGQVPQAILHFVDADMRLLSKNTPELIRKLQWPKDVAYICGMVRNPYGEQNPFNFGPRPSFWNFPSSAFQYFFWLIGLKHKRLAAILRNLFGLYLSKWPDVYAEPKRCQVFWTAESNMIIKSTVFEELGGYDPVFRYSEIIDLSVRLHRLGLKVIFDPRADVLHATMDNIYNTKRKRLTARRQFFRKYGRLNYYAPPLADYLAGLKTQKRYQR